MIKNELTRVEQRPEHVFPQPRQLLRRRDKGAEERHRAQREERGGHQAPETPRPERAETDAPGSLPFDEKK